MRRAIEYKESLDDRWFNLIAEGTKTIECRKRSTKRFAQIAVGDFFDFYPRSNPKMHCYCKIVEINCYKGPKALERLLEKEKLELVLPGIKTIEEAVQIYKADPINWTNEEIEEGVFALRLEKIGVEVEDK